VSHCIFVSGTDTGVGKTLVSCAIIAALRRDGVEVGVYKPVETGCRDIDGALVGTDCESLRAAAGGVQESDEVSSYLFRVPAAPLVAASAAGEVIKPQRFRDDFERIANDFEFVVVEGAGGLLVPISNGFTYLDLARELGLPLLCVAASRLGCVNHTLLTLAAAGRGALAISGYILNSIESADDCEIDIETNRETIARFTPYDDLGVFPFIESKRRDDYDHLGRIAAGALGLSRLLVG